MQEHKIHGHPKLKFSVVLLEEDVKKKIQGLMKIDKDIIF